MGQAGSLTHVYPKAKASGKKLQKVTLKVSPRGIILTDNITNQLIENVSIYRYAQHPPHSLCCLGQLGGVPFLNLGSTTFCLGELGASVSSCMCVWGWGMETDTASQRC